MRNKFTLLLVFCLISFQLDAAIQYIETEFSYHFYQDNTENTIVSIPKDANKFLNFGEQELKIDEKLGSYHLEKDLISSTRKITLQDIQIQDNQNILLLYNYTFKKQSYSLQIELTTQYNSTLSSTYIQLNIKNEFAPAINFFNITFLDNSTAIFGGGVQFSECNLKGFEFPLIVEENGVGRGDKGPTFWAKLLGASGSAFSTYAPMPTFITSNHKNYLLNSGKSNLIWEVDFTATNQVRFQANLIDNSSLNNLNISFENLSPMEHASTNNLRKYEVDLNLKDWMYSYILGVQGGKAKVNKLIKQLQENNIIVGAIWIQDWVGKRQTSIGSRLQWDWHPNEEVYPNLKTWIDSLHQENIKVLGYINPYFVDGGDQAQEGTENGYFVKNKNHSPYKFKAGGFEAYMLDPSNPDAVLWVKNIIGEHLLQNNFDGYMLDFGEWLPFKNTKVTNSEFYHNNFPTYWNEISNSTLESYQYIKNENPSLSNGTLKDDFFVFNRSWYSEEASTPKNLWLGDQMGSFGKNDGLPSAVNAYNSASLSGFPIIHSDIGGYTAIQLGPVKHLRNDEVLQRWIEMEAFTPLWRSHEGLIPESMSQIYQDVKMMQFFAYFDSIHQNLIPYFKKVNQDLIDYGIPMVRHPFLMYPNDENIYNIQYQFFVGNDLLVCPVVEENANSVKAYLPEGNWKHFFTGEVFEGGSWQTFEAEIGNPVAFWREN